MGEFVFVRVDVYVNVNLTLSAIKKGALRAPKRNILAYLVYPYRYFGSHSVRPGQTYMNTMHRMTISM